MSPDFQSRQVTRRRFIGSIACLAGSATALPLLAACSTPPAAAPATQAPKPAASAAPAATSAPAPAATAPATAAPAVANKAPVTLVVETYMWEEPGSKDWFEWLASKYTQQYPYVKIERRVVPSAQYWDKLMTEIQAKTVGDVFQGRVELMDQWIAVGGLEPLDQRLDIKDIQANFPKWLLGKLSKNSALYALPYFLTTSRAVIYNKKHFQDAGVEMPGAGQTDKWLAILKQLTKAPDRYGIALTTSFTSLYHRYDVFVSGFGGQFSLPDGKPALNSKENVEATKLYRAIVEAGVTPVGVEPNVYNPMIWNGNISSTCTGSWFFGSAKMANGTAFSQLAASPGPFPSMTALPAYATFHISSASKVKPEAAAWLTLSATEEAAVKEMEFRGDPHPRQFKVPDDLKKQMPWLEVFNQIANASPVLDLNPGFTLVRAESEQIILRNAAQGVMGKMSVEDALNNGQKELEALSKREGGKTF
jgi:ABC-type glycerol-3-phosphate transport system substrate-binding protein